MLDGIFLPGSDFAFAISSGSASEVVMMSSSSVLWRGCRLLVRLSALPKRTRAGASYTSSNDCSEFCSRLILLLFGQIQGLTFVSFPLPPRGNARTEQRTIIEDFSLPTVSTVSVRAISGAKFVAHILHPRRVLLKAQTFVLQSFRIPQAFCLNSSTQLWLLQNTIWSGMAVSPSQSITVVVLDVLVIGLTPPFPG
jgi:hypothetical protein